MTNERASRQNSKPLALPLTQRAREPQSQSQEAGGAGYEHWNRAETVEHDSVDGDAQRLPEVERGGKNRHRRAARFRCHLGGVGLQRVMHHVVAKPDGHDRGRREIGVRRERNCQVGEGEHDTAGGDEPDLAEPVHQTAHRQAVDQTADGEGAYEKSDQGKIDSETQSRSAPTNAKAPNMKRASMKPMAITARAQGVRSTVA